MKNRCSLQKYHKMYLFPTFSCNQREHFGVNMLREKSFIGLKLLFKHEQNEIERALEQSSLKHILCNLMEVR